jgi:hypothetical protein
MGILHFWAFYETDLLWTSFKENLEWGLVLLAQVEKKRWVACKL